MKFICPLSKKKYLYELRQQLRPWTDFGQERYSGFVLGNFFCITHYSGLEMHYGKFFSSRNSAMGFVSKHGDETLVRAITTYGHFDLFCMIGWFLFSLLITFLQGSSMSLPLPHIFLIAAGIALFICLASAWGHWMVEESRNNMLELRALLENPRPFWADTEESE